MAGTIVLGIRGSLAFATVACFLAGTDAVRQAQVDTDTDAAALASQENATDLAERLGCHNFCVQCRDGSTVWYGRDKGWFRAGINIIFEWHPIGLIAQAITKARKESFTSWTGYFPTSGLECEKVDIIKYPMDSSEKDAWYPLMLASRNWLGRIKVNELKPYYTDKTLKHGFQEDDLQSYKKGCKVIKASGFKGKAKQLGSAFQSKCNSYTTKGAFKCAEHSKICGGHSGGVYKMLHADTADDCKHQKGNMNLPDVCPSPHSASSYTRPHNPYGSSYDQPYQQPAPYHQPYHQPYDQPHDQPWDPHPW